MVRPFWFARQENFQNEREVLKGSPKFPTGVFKLKIVFHLPFSTSSRSRANSQTRSRLSVNQSDWQKWNMLISNGISHSGGFAYHLQKLQTNWFPLVNGKHPQLGIRDFIHPRCQLSKQLYSCGLRVETSPGSVSYHLPIPLICIRWDITFNFRKLHHRRSNSKKADWEAFL